MNRVVNILKLVDCFSTRLELILFIWSIRKGTTDQRLTKHLSSFFFHKQHFVIWLWPEIPQSSWKHNTKKYKIKAMKYVFPVGNADMPAVIVCLAFILDRKRKQNESLMKSGESTRVCPHLIQTFPVCTSKQGCILCLLHALGTLAVVPEFVQNFYFNVLYTDWSTFTFTFTAFTAFSWQSNVHQCFRYIRVFKWKSDKV